MKTEPFPTHLGPNHIVVEDIPLFSQYAFQLFDKDETGVLSRGEILELHRSLRMLSVLPEQSRFLTEEGMKGLEDIVNILDMDNDGRVTCEDFQAFVTKFMVNDDMTSSRNGILPGYERNLDAEKILYGGNTALDDIERSQQLERQKFENYQNPYLAESVVTNSVAKEPLSGSKYGSDAKYEKYFRDTPPQAEQNLTSTTAFNNIGPFDNFKDGSTVVFNHQQTLTNPLSQNHMSPLAGKSPIYETKSEAQP
jgi:hypothetical protein